MNDTSNDNRKEPGMNTQWDYKVLTYQLSWTGFKYDKIEKDLIELGREGWEMNSTIAPSFGAGQAIEVALILKKPS